MSRLQSHCFGSIRGCILSLALLLAAPSLSQAQFGYGGWGGAYGYPGMGYGGFPGMGYGGFPGMGYGYGGFGMPFYGGYGGWGGWGYPGFGYGGVGFPGYGYGFGAPWGFAAVGYPFAYSSIYDWAINPMVVGGTAYTAVASGRVNPYMLGYPYSVYAASYNPLFAMGLSPLAVESALGEYLLSRGRPPLLAPASMPVPIPVPVAEDAPQPRPEAQNAEPAAEDDADR